MAEPLRALLRNDEKFVWSEAVQHSFESIKNTIAKSPVLGMYDPDLDVMLTTDASAYGLGAVLTQEKKWSRNHNPMREPHPIQRRKKILCW